MTKEYPDMKFLPTTLKNALMVISHDELQKSTEQKARKEQKQSKKFKIKRTHYGADADGRITEKK